MKKLIFVSIFWLTAGIAISAQPRPLEKQPEKKTEKQVQTKQALPESFEAKYEGGVFGYSDKEKGTLKFEDENERLVFYGKDQKEKFSIPYQAILLIYPSETKVQSGTGRTIGSIPVPGAGIGSIFMKKKKYRLVLQFSDPDVEAQGVTNFLMDTGELLTTAIQAIGEKANLVPRGNAYYRPKNKTVELR